MDEQLIKAWGNAPLGAVIVTLLWFGRSAYKQYAGKNTVKVVKLINGQYAAKVRRGIGLLKWVKDDRRHPDRAFRVGPYGSISQFPDEKLALGAAKEILAYYGVSTVDRINVARCGFTEEEPSL